MTKGIKITLGCIMLVPSLIWFMVVIISATGAKENASYHMEAYVEAEYAGGEYLEKEMIEDSGYELPDEDGFEFYRLDFEVHNLSAVSHYGNPEYYFGVTGSKGYARNMWKDTGNIYEKMFYYNAEPVLPGKSSVLTSVYVMAEEGEETVYVSYRPEIDDWEADKVELEIQLPR